MNIDYNDAIEMLGRMGFHLISEKNGVRRYESANGKSFSLRTGEALSAVEADVLAKMYWDTMIDTKKLAIKSTASKDAGMRNMLFLAASFIFIILILLFAARFR